MMKKIVNNIPLLAFVLAAASAMAFNMPAQEQETVYGLTYDQNNNEVWHPVDPDREGIDFQCNGAMSTCLYSEQSTSSTPIKPGEFEELP